MENKVDVIYINDPYSNIGHSLKDDTIYIVEEYEFRRIENMLYHYNVDRFEFGFFNIEDIEITEWIDLINCPRLKCSIRSDKDTIKYIMKQFESYKFKRTWERQKEISNNVLGIKDKINKIDVDYSDSDSDSDMKKLKMLYIMRKNIKDIIPNIYKDYNDVLIDNGEILYRNGEVIQQNRSDIKRSIERKIIYLERKINKSLDIYFLKH